MQQRLGKRNELQQQITKIDQSILKQQKTNRANANTRSMETSNHLPKKNQANIKYSNIPEPETTRKQKKGKKQIKQYRDEILINHKKQELNNKIQINIPQNKQIINMRKTYRDTTRKRKNVLSKKYKEHGKINYLNKTWYSRKIEKEMQELIKAAERNDMKPIWEYQKKL